MEQHNEHKRAVHYRHISRNMIVVMTVVSLTPLVLTAAIVLFYLSDAYHQKVREQLGELVLKHGQSIDAFLGERLAAIRTLARSNGFPRLASIPFLKDRLDLLNQEYRGVYVDLGFLASDGLQVAYAGPFSLLRANYEEAVWFKEAMSREHYISDVFTGLRGTPHFIIAVKQAYAGSDWLLRATIDFEAFNSLVENQKIGNTGFEFILNIRGEFQTAPRSEVVLSRPPYTDFLSGQLKTGEVYISEAWDVEGKKVLVAMLPIKGGEWVLCAQQEYDDAYQVLRQTERLLLALILVGGALIILVVVIISRRLIRRIASTDKEVESMNEKILEAGRLASIGELAAGIAHEINNPVAIMVEEAGWIDDLLDDDDESKEETREEIRRAARQIRTQGARCKEITHKLLSFARKTDPRIQEVNLNEAVDSMIGLLRQKARYGNVKVEAALGENMPPIAASPSELQQVMLNLVNNAIDAIGSHGGNVTLSTRREDGWAVLDVTDDGPGIPEPVLTRIFDPFFTTKPVGQGTGLGLSICYGIVDKLGGEVRVQSRVGEGTTFSVRLPAAGSRPQAAAPTQSETER